MKNNKHYFWKKRKRNEWLLQRNSMEFILRSRSFSHRLPNDDGKKGSLLVFKHLIRLENSENPENGRR
jgi:hypothetical protein